MMKLTHVRIEAVNNGFIVYDEPAPSMVRGMSFATEPRRMVFESFGAMSNWLAANMIDIPQP